MRAHQNLVADSRSINIFVALAGNRQRAKGRVKCIANRRVDATAVDEPDLIDKPAEQPRTPLFRELAKDGSRKQARQSRSLRCAVNE